MENIQTAKGCKKKLKNAGSQKNKNLLSLPMVKCSLGKIIRAKCLSSEIFPRWDYITMVFPHGGMFSRQIVLMAECHVANYFRMKYSWAKASTNKCRHVENQNGCSHKMRIVTPLQWMKLGRKFRSFGHEFRSLMQSIKILYRLANYLHSNRQHANKTSSMWATNNECSFGIANSMWRRKLKHFRIPCESKVATKYDLCIRLRWMG